MIISRDALGFGATDRVRGAEAIRGFIPCELDRAEGFKAVRKSVNRLVVTIRLSIRTLYCGITATNEDIKGSFRGELEE
jgi:hypothetical protein